MTKLHFPAPQKKFFIKKHPPTSPSPKNQPNTTPSTHPPLKYPLSRQIPETNGNRKSRDPGWPPDFQNLNPCRATPSHEFQIWFWALFKNPFARCHPLPAKNISHCKGNRAKGSKQSIHSVYAHNRSKAVLMALNRLFTIPKTTQSDLCYFSPPYSIAQKV